MASRTVKVREIFDASKFTRYQYAVCGLCFLAMFLDGYDMAVMGVVVPKIADFLHTKPAALAIAITAGQIGPLVGAMTMGMAGDKLGRKWVLFFSACIFGIFGVMTAFSTSVEQLTLFRFFTGIGLGGAVPVAMAFGSEYAPSRYRATVAATMWAAIPLGATLSGVAAAWLLPRFGWQSVLMLGGVIPILIAVAVAAFLPESLEFLVRHGKDERRIRRIVGKISPELAEDPQVSFSSSEEKLPGVPLKRLFREDRALLTVLIWAMCFGANYMLWILNAWLPTLLKMAGASVRQYSLAFAFIGLGAFIGTILVGRLMDKANPLKVLQGGFVLAFLALLAFGYAAGSSFLLVAVLSLVCGICINGPQGGTMTIPAIYYPADIRGTGVGWAYGSSKVGSSLAPLVGGYLLSRNWNASQLCGINSVLGLILAAVALILYRHMAGRQKAAAVGT